MKKLLILLMVTVMLVAMIPMSTGVAFAATWVEVSDGGIGFNSSNGVFVNITMPKTDNYYTYGNNTRELASNTNTLPSGDYTWAVKKHDIDINGCQYTMTLNNFNISSTNITDDALMFKCNLNLVISGTNVINAPSAGSALSGFDHVNLYISGSGSLNVTGKDRGINVMNNLTINGGTVTATGLKPDGDGIYCEGNLIISDGTVTAIGKDFGINGSHDITISGGTVDASGNYGMRATEGFIISGGMTTAMGTTRALFQKPTLTTVPAIASGSVDGNSHMAYKSDDNDSYKWFRAGKEYAISLTPTTHTFDAKAEGYASAPVLTVTVTNIGVTPTGILNLALTGDNSDSFTLSQTTMTSLAVIGSSTFTVQPNIGLTAGTYTATVEVSNTDISQSQILDVTFTVNSAPTGGGYYMPSAPAIIISDQQGGNTGGKAAYDNLTNKITITPDEGYQIKDVTVNGKSMGPVDELTGIYGWDKVKVTFEKKESAKTPEQLAAEKNAKLTAGVKGTRIIYPSANRLKNGKVKLTYKKTKGYALDYYQIYRSAKKTSGFKKAFQTKNRYFITGKDLTQGKTLFFKVRGARKIGGKLVYTQFSRVESIKIK